MELKYASDIKNKLVFKENEIIYIFAFFDGWVRT